MATVINLTPHPIVFQAADGTRTTYPPSGQEVRMKQTPGELGTATFGDIEVLVQTAATFGGFQVWEGKGSNAQVVAEDFPAPQDGVVYIVSAMVLAQAKGRADVFGPGTGPQDQPVRYPADHPNEKLRGMIEAVTRFNAAPLS